VSHPIAPREEDDPLYEIALRVADDLRVDWDLVRRIAGRASKSIDRLREIEAVRDAYRRDTLSGPGAPGASDSSE
jgi:hypothetical protein